LSEAFIAAWRSDEAEERLTELLTVPCQVIFIPTEGPMAIKQVNTPDSVASLANLPLSMGGSVEVHEGPLLCDRDCCQLPWPAEDLSNNSILSRICFGEDSVGESMDLAWGPVRIEIVDTHP
jgi:hypothetical protein